MCVFVCFGLLTIINFFAPLFRLQRVAFAILVDGTSMHYKYVRGLEVPSCPM